MSRISPPGTLSARVVLRTVEFCRRRGHDAAALCESAQVSLELLRDPNARVPYGAVARLAERALAITGDVDFGLHLAEDVGEPEHFDIGLLLMMASPTVGAAMERFAASQRYWGDGPRATFLRVEGGMVIRYALPGAEGNYARHANECAMAEIALGVRVLSGQPLGARVVRFAHAAPERLGEHRRVFACPLEFDAHRTEIEFDDAVLEAPLPQANAAFLAIFQQQMDAALARLPAPADATSAVRDVARAALLGGNCNLAETARAMGVSTRTLQRRLQAEGTSFAEVVDALRREIALAYVHKQVPLAEIATLLGYSDATAFHHAFRRWTGVSPARHAAGVTEN